MNDRVGLIEQFMTADHAVLDRFLAESERGDGTIDEVSYTRFRQGLLRHIGMEEKVLLPFARARRADAPLPMAASLRRDHGEIAKLLVRSPSAASLASLREILGRHNPLEEGPDGLYAACDALCSSDDAGILLERLLAQPEVPLAPYYDGPAHRTSRLRAP
jgi:hypothetical protein